MFEAFEMHKRKTNTAYTLVYSLGEHPYLGFLIEPHVVMLNPNGSLSFTHKRLFSSTSEEFDEILDDTDRRLIRLLDEIEQSHLIKKYHKQNIRPADYFSKIFNPEIYAFLRPKIEARLLQAIALLNGKPFYLMGKEGYPADQPIQIAASPASVLFHFRRNETETRYFPTIKYEGNRIEFMFRNAQIIINEQAWMLLDQVLYHFDQPLEGKKLNPFLQKRYISVPRATERKYFEMFVSGLIEKHHVYAEGFDIKTLTHEAVPVLKNLSADPENNRFELLFEYGPYLFPAVSDTKVTVRMEYNKEDDHYTFYRIRRSRDWERSKLDSLIGKGLKPQDGLFDYLLVDTAVLKNAENAENSGSTENPQIRTALDWLVAHRADLREDGFKIIQENLQTPYFLGKTSLSFQVSEGNDWFDIHAMAHFGEYEVPFLALRDHILSGNRSFALPNGEIAIIPEEWFARYPQLFHFSQNKHELRLKKHHVGLLDELSSFQEVTMERKLENLQSYEGMPDVQPPAGFKGELRAYQQAGFNWFYFLRQYRFGGCLADDMGLGKTIQALALLQKEKELAAEQGKRHYTSLIIMPTSLIYNWQREAEKFVPDLRIFVYTGTGREKDPALFGKYDVIITTYGIARVDADLFQDFYFHYIMLDESQQIKNPSSKSFKMVKGLRSTHRLVLTGTPVENSVADLWPQMTFLNPGLLGSHHFFQQEFVQPIEKKKDEERAARLHALIKPFVLRRTKEQVATELPPKSEQVVYCEMEEEQTAYYERVKSEYRNTILEGLIAAGGERAGGSGSDARNGVGGSAVDSRGDTAGTGADFGATEKTKQSSQIALLQGLSKLRQIANHPAMIDRNYEGSSGKFEQVLQHLDTVLQRGNKVLIFSQFVKQLVLFRQHFEKENIAYAYLDGATTDRAAVVDRFRRDDEVRLFLISIKAGGVGLNLTEADYVFVLDPWWNPAVEQQAIDRAHRIGQRRNVFIYKFISKDTVEEKILALQERKTRIAESLIVTEESFFKSLDLEDIRSLLE